MNAAFSSILFLLSVSLQEETFISTFLSIHFSLISLSSFISLLCQFSFIAYIRNLRNLALYTIKNNKKLGDLIAKSPSPINTLYNRFY